MKKVLLLAGLAATAAFSVSLAAQPKPMDCDSWQCKGNSCAPAKYVSVRNSPILRWLDSSPVNGAFLFEGSIVSALLVAGVFSRRRRREELGGPAPLPADEA
jgi:hypothetical protein